MVEKISNLPVQKQVWFAPLLWMLGLGVVFAGDYGTRLWYDLPRPNGYIFAPPDFHLMGIISTLRNIAVAIVGVACLLFLNWSLSAISSFRRLVMVAVAAGIGYKTYYLALLLYSFQD